MLFHASLPGTLTPVELAMAHVCWLSAGMALRAWKSFLELRTQQRAALEGAFRCAAAAEDLQALGTALQAWRSLTTTRAQVSRTPVPLALCL